MAFHVATKDKVFEVCEYLRSLGHKPTLTAIKKALGGRGNNATVSEYLEEWKDMQENIKQAVESVPTGAAENFDQIKTASHLLAASIEGVVRKVVQEQLPAVMATVLEQEVKSAVAGSAAVGSPAPADGQPSYEELAAQLEKQAEIMEMAEAREQEHMAEREKLEKANERQQSKVAEMQAALDAAQEKLTTLEQEAAGGATVAVQVEGGEIEEELDAEPVEQASAEIDRDAIRERMLENSSSNKDFSLTLDELSESDSDEADEEATEEVSAAAESVPAPAKKMEAVAPRPAKFSNGFSNMV